MYPGIAHDARSQVAARRTWDPPYATAHRDGSGGSTKTLRPRVPKERYGTRRLPHTHTHALVQNFELTRGLGRNDLRSSAVTCTGILERIPDYYPTLLALV